MSGHHGTREEKSRSHWIGLTPNPEPFKSRLNSLAAPGHSWRPPNALSSPLPPLPLPFLLGKRLPRVGGARPLLSGMVPAPFLDIYYIISFVRNSTHSPCPSIINAKERLTQGGIAPAFTPHIFYLVFRSPFPTCKYIFMMILCCEQHCI